VQIAQAAGTFLDIGFQIVGDAKVPVVALLLFQRLAFEEGQRVALAVQAWISC
jgi:hypothetical protein